MKNTVCILAAIAALVPTGNVSAAGREEREARRTRYESEPTAWRVVKYPFRASRTLARTPLILGETVIGRRSVFSERGFLAEKERDESLTMRRVAFAGDQPDND